MTKTNKLLSKTEKLFNFGRKNVWSKIHIAANAIWSNDILCYFQSQWAKSLYNMRQKSVQNHRFLVKLTKNLHYGPISKKKALQFFFPIDVF
jgi:hypothetical protein